MTDLVSISREELDLISNDLNALKKLAYEVGLEVWGETDANRILSLLYNQTTN